MLNKFILVITLLLMGAFAAQAYDVGRVSRDWFDEDREISVPVEIFYPATENGNNVPIAIPPDGGFPVIAFAHGYFIPWSDYSYVWEALVPEGYVLLMVRSGGEIDPDLEKFAQDISFLTRFFQQQSLLPESLWFHKVSEKNGVMGHSMGGGASLLVAAQDPTVDTVINFAAAETNPSAIAAAESVTVPTLMITGSNDCVSPFANNQAPMYDALASDTRSLITIDGASHCQFSDYNWLCELGEGACATPSITRQEQHDYVIQYSLPFLDFYLKGELTAWAEFRQELSDEDGIDFSLDTNVPYVLIGVSAEEEPIFLDEDGGDIVYELQVVNTVGTELSGGIWTQVRLPSQYLISPFSYEALTLGPYESFEPELRSQDFPGPVAGGIYKFIFNVGEYPSTLLHSDRLTIIKESPDDERAFNWSQFGATLTGDGSSATIPDKFAVSPAWPNPFNATTNFTVTLPNNGPLRVDVYDVTGRLAATLTDQIWSAGTHQLSFDAASLATGIYFVRAITPGHTAQVQKVMVVK
jgi:pimeloyl-ACP methyl ester carboxylesterase